MANMKDKDGNTLLYASYAAATLGFLISLYLTLYHYIGIPLACSTSGGLIDCASVLNSPYAYILGIPMAVFGMIFFAVFLILLYINNKDSILIWNLIGIGTVVYLLDIEHIVGHICIWCTAVHVLVLALLVLTIYRTIHKKP
jgi:uncharacterized membrane protein